MTTNGGANLRPLGIGELLDAAVKVYSRNFKTLTLAVLIPIFTVSLLQSLILVGALENPDDVTEDGFAIAFLATFVLFGLALAVSLAASFHAVIRGYLADGTTWQESLKVGLKRLPSLIGLGLLVLFLVAVIAVISLILGAIFPPLILIGVVFGTWFSVRISMSAPAMLAERAGPIDAQQRSFELVKGRWWPVFGALLAMTILVVVLQILANLIIGASFIDPDNLILGLAVSTIATTLQYTITFPIQAAVITLLYYDLRVRKEGYDLQLAAHGLGEPAPAVQSSPPAEAPGGFTPAPAGGAFAPPPPDSR